MRAELALILKPIIKAKAKKNQIRKPVNSVLKNSSKQKTNTREELAKISGTSEDTIRKVIVIKNEGSDEVYNIKFI